MPETFKALVEELPRFKAEAEALRETLLANLVMTSEIPSPTFEEGDRIRFLQDRLSECGLLNSSTDEVGNGLAVLPGTDGEKSILVVAHADTLFPRTVDHTITVEPEQVVGPGVGDNSLGVAVIATLPTLIQRLGLSLNANLILMGAVRSLGRGDLEGLRFFLRNYKDPIVAGVCIEGVHIGRLGFASVGMLRGEITCAVPPEYDWSRFGTSGAILTLNEVINRIAEVPVPRRPRTSIVLGSIGGGTTYSTAATHATLRFEIRSESAELVDDIRQQFEDIVIDVSNQTGARVDLDIFASRKPGGIDRGHPLARKTRTIMRALGLQPRLEPSISELSAFITRRIPAVTLGITSGERLHEIRESVRIEPMFAGLAQLLGVILAIDGGFCDERR